MDFIFLQQHFSEYSEKPKLFLFISVNDFVEILNPKQVTSDNIKFGGEGDTYLYCIFE